jgi:hypothetical protein
MGFTVSSLTNYIDEQKLDLITAIHFEGATASMAMPHPGIKSSEDIHLLSSTPVPQDASACGFNASGDTTFGRANLAVSPVKWEDLLCLKDLEAKYTQLFLKKGSKYTEADIPGKIIQDITDVIGEQLETADWLGDTSSSNVYINRYNGIRKIIAAASGTNTATASTWNLTNARAIMKSIISAIPARLKGNAKVEILCGYDVAETYRQALMDANLYHVPAGSKDQQNIYVEGSVHKLTPVHGLDGLATSTGVANPFIFALIPDRHLHLGFDMLNEEEKAEMGMDQYKKNVWYSFEIKRGWQIIYANEIVEYANS